MPTQKAYSSAPSRRRELERSILRVHAPACSPAGGGASITLSECIHVQLQTELTFHDL